MLTLERPDVDIVVLDETILSETVACRYFDAEAEWRWVTRCCGDPVFVCAKHDAKAVVNATKHFAEPGIVHVCPACQALLGEQPEFDHVYRRHTV